MNHRHGEPLGQDVRAPKTSAWHTGGCRWTAKTWLGLASEEGVRKLRIPIAWLARDLRGEAFVMGSLVSWCVSSSGQTYNPTIDQIAARAALCPRATQRHIADLRDMEKSPIKRLHSSGRRTSTSIVDGVLDWQHRTGYLEIPVAALWYVASLEPAAGLLARCVLAALMNRLTLTARLSETGEYGEVDPDSELTVKAIARKTHVRPCRVRESIGELRVCGVPVSVDPYDNIAFQFDDELAIACCHDTLINWKNCSSQPKRNN